MHVLLHIAELYMVAGLGVLVGIGIGSDVFRWVRARSAPMRARRLV